MSQQLLEALTSCVNVMERELNGLAVIQPELRQAREALASAEAQPEPWDGEGLPPVGTVCEAQIGASWVECTVLVHHAIEGRPCAVWVTPDGKKSGIWDAPGFRPIRTPEQIAREERLAAINYMEIDAGLCGTGFDGDPEARVWIVNLIDRGWRKQPASVGELLTCLEDLVQCSFPPVGADTKDLQQRYRDVSERAQAMIEKHRKQVAP